MVLCSIHVDYLCRHIEICRRIPRSSYKGVGAWILRLIHPFLNTLEFKSLVEDQPEF